MRPCRADVAAGHEAIALVRELVTRVRVVPTPRGEAVGLETTTTSLLNVKGSNWYGKVGCGGPILNQTISRCLPSRVALETDLLRLPQEPVDQRWRVLVGHKLQRAPEHDLTYLRFHFTCRPLNQRHSRVGGSLLYTHQNKINGLGDAGSDR